MTELGKGPTIQSPSSPERSVGTPTTREIPHPYAVDQPIARPSYHVKEYPQKAVEPPIPLLPLEETLLGGGNRFERQEKLQKASHTKRREKMHLESRRPLPPRTQRRGG